MEPKNPLLFTTAQKLSLSRADKSNSLPFSYLLTFILYRHHVCAWVSEIVPFFEASPSKFCPHFCPISFVPLFYITIFRQGFKPNRLRLFIPESSGGRPVGNMGGTKL